jgi:hypothetical protein
MAQNRWVRIFGMLLLAVIAQAQVIEFETNGLKYKTLTRRGVTVMFAYLPTGVREYSIVQVAVSNGSGEPASVPATAFVYRREDGTEVRASEPGEVIRQLVDRGNRDDVVKLVSAYEMGLYGMVRFRSTNSYEQRRQAALAEVSSTKLKAAAAASAVAFVGSRLDPGDSTDGILFLPTHGRPLGDGRLVVSAMGEVFDFGEDPPPAALQTR